MSSSEERDASPERTLIQKPLIVPPEPEKLSIAEVEQIALQQSIYKAEKPETPTQAQLQKQQAKAEDELTGIYLQGLPDTITEEELFEFCKKGGIIKKNPKTGEPKVKLYRDSEGRPKGEALVIYLKPESVNLAINLLDEAHIIPGRPVSVKAAEFREKGPKKKKNKGYVPAKIKKKGRRIDQDKELGWDEDDRVHVIIKNMFDHSALSIRTSQQFYEELRNDVAIECATFGEVGSVKVFERNPEGVVAVVFKEHDAAELCIEKMNGRLFDGRRLEADYYDGLANYFVEESEEEKKARFQLFEEWAEKGDAAEEEAS